METYISLIGVAIAFCTLIFMMMKGVNLFVTVITASVIAIAASGMNIYETLTQNYMTGFADYYKSYYLVFFCGTLLGTVMEVSGAATSIAANKVKGAYAACVHDVYQAQRAELSNHANIITMGSQVVGIELAKCMVKEYLSCTFDPNGRSGAKVERIIDFENEQLS